MQLIVKKKGLYAVVLSLIFAAFITLAPWEAWRGSEFRDRANYINTIDYTINLVQIIDFDTIQSKLTGEWLWHEILYFCTDTLGFSSTEILFIITFFICLVSALLLTTRFHPFSFLFLLNPVFVNFAYSQLRLALAMSLLITAYYLFKRRNWLYIPLALATPFIHTSSVLFIFMFASAAFIDNRFKSIEVKTFFSVLSGFAVGVISGPFMSQILAALGDRRAEYGDINSSLAYLSFWVVLLAYFLFKGFFKRQDKPFDFYLAVTTLTIIAFHAVTNGYPTRFLAACFPFIIAAMLSNKSQENIFVILFYVAYTIILWVYWFTYGS